MTVRASIWLFVFAVASPCQILADSDAPTNTHFVAAPDLSKQLLRESADVISLYRYVNHAIVEEKMTQGSLPRCCPECISIDQKHYYESMNVFLEKTSQYDRHVAGMNQKYISACAQEVPIGTIYTAKGLRESACRKTFFITVSTVKSVADYQVFRQNDGLHLRQKINFSLNSDLSPLRRNEIKKNTERCVVVMKSFWLRYGVHYDFDYQFTEKYKEDNMGIVDDQCGSRPTGVCYQGGVEFHFKTEAERQSHYCNVLLHEASHRLGLPDEYSNDFCPDNFNAPEKKPWSIMGEATHPIDQIDFFERHLRTIFGPACGEPGKFLPWDPKVWDVL